MNIRDKKIKTQNKNKHQIIIEIKASKTQTIKYSGHGPKEDMGMCRDEGQMRVGF